MSIDRIAPTRVWEAKINSVSLAIVAFILSVVAFKQAKSFLIPIVIAFYLWLLVKPFSRFLTERGVSKFVSSPLLIILAVSILFAVGSFVVQPANYFFNEMPKNAKKIERTFYQWKNSIESVSDKAEELSDLTELGNDNGSEVKLVESKSVLEVIFANSRIFLSAAFVSFIFVYLLLLYGDEMTFVITRFWFKEATVDGVKESLAQVENAVSSFLLTILFINVCLAMTIAFTLSMFGMPNALFWGLLGGLMNFIPYLGPLITGLLLTVTSLLMFTVPFSLLPPAAFFLITSIEGSLVTPSIVGRQLYINPVIVFLWLVFWGWLWGPVGALLAGPSLVTAGIASSRFKAMRDSYIHSDEQSEDPSEEESKKIASNNSEQYVPSRTA